MAPSAPRPPDRWTTLRLRTLAVVGALALTACSSGDGNTDSVAGDDGQGSPVSTTVSSPATTTATASADPSDGDDDSTEDAAKPEPARDAGAVEMPAGVRPEGFSVVTARVTSADGEVCEVCLWLADSSEERARGLMGVTELGAPVGMVFRFDEVVAGNFWMFGTPMPLSIAWFTPEGEFVDAADMEPCVTDDSTTCARYGPGAEYLFAVEMVQGELGVIGIGAGSRFEILDEHESCP